jgi:hypothetical protein
MTDQTPITPPPASPAQPVATVPPVTPPPAAPKKLGNGIGLAALIVAIVAFVFAVIPVISFIAWLPALVALILAIVGLTRKGRSKVTSVIALVLSIVAGIVGLIVSVVVVAGAVSSVHDQDVKAANKSVTIEYKVTGSGAKKADVTYDTFTTAGSDTSISDDSAKLPFDKTVVVKRGGTFDFNTFTLSAVGGFKNEKLRCTILINGKVADTATASGKLALATCEADSSDLDK